MRSQPSGDRSGNLVRGHKWALAGFSGGGSSRFSVGVGAMNRIRELRKEKGIRGTILAQQMDVPRQTLWRWETGQVEPNGRHLLELARVLNVAPEELLEQPRTVPLTLPVPLAFECDIKDRKCG